MTKIFVYGTLKRGNCRAGVLRNQQFLGEATTAPSYRLFEVGSYPALVVDDNGLSVEGELWEVDPECLTLLDEIEGVPTLYQRMPVVIDDPPGVEAETYVYQPSVAGLAECGCRWNAGSHVGGPHADDEPLWFCDGPALASESRRDAVDIVCAGDSITGWNNFGPATQWPFPTYPRFLQVLASPRGLRVFDGGIAGEISANGLGHVVRYLDLFESARYVVIGFGTNDLGEIDDYEAASRHVIEQLGLMVETVRESNKQPILLGVPYVKESLFSAGDARLLHEGRDFHNNRLREFCRSESIPFADICPALADEHFGDHVHPNAQGARRIAEVVFSVLCSILR